MLNEQINIIGANTIKIKWDDFPHFTFPWHYHREFEIVYILKSNGKRFVGDSVEEFKEGDLVLIGSNLPHFWKNADEYYQENSGLRVNAVVVQFPEQLPGINIAQLPEFGNIREMLIRAEKGIHFSNPDGKTIGEDLVNLQTLTGIDRYLEFIKILEKMARSQNYKLLASSTSKQMLPAGIEKRLERILNFINRNYNNDLNVNEIAKQAGMNSSSFCRYFKDGTGKTIVEYIHELRIGFACKLLIDGNKNISEIAFECGFNNISNFNRIFKKRISMTPSAYISEVSKVP